MPEGHITMSAKIGEIFDLERKLVGFEVDSIQMDVNGIKLGQNVDFDVFPLKNLGICKPRVQHRRGIS